MAKKIRLIVHNEVFWNKGLIYSQNIVPLKKLQQHRKEFRLEIIAYTSIHQLLKYNSDIFKFKKDFSDINCKIKIRPILFLPIRRKLFYWVNIILMFLSSLPFVIVQSIEDSIKREEIFYHLRSYFAAFLYTNYYKGNGKLIFDPRSDFISENINIGTFGMNSRAYRFWIRQEKNSLMRCNTSLFISNSMKNTLTERHGFDSNQNNFQVFYNTIDFSNFDDALTAVREEKEINFLYTGSLGHWNNISRYLDFFKGIKTAIPDAKLTILTSSNEQQYLKQINNIKYKSILPDITIHRNVAYHNLQEYYKKCHIGLQLLEFEDSRIGVKFVEYIASGLIPLVNTNVKGAIEFCNDELGLIIDANAELDYKKIANEVKKLIVKNRSKSIKNLKPLFDVNEVCKKLTNLYN